MNAIIQKYRRLKFLYNGVSFQGNSFIESGVYIYAQSSFFNTLNGKCVFGSDIKLSTGTIFQCYGGIIQVGNNVFIGEYCIFYGHGNITIGNNTLIAPGSKIIASNHTVADRKQLINQQPDIKLPIVIGSDVWLGADVKVLAGVTIGDGCVVGAGSVVNKSLPPYSYAVGVPVKIIKERK